MTMITLRQARAAAAASRRTCDADGYGHQVLVWRDGGWSVSLGDNDVVARAGRAGDWEYPILRLREPQINGEAVIASLG